jgi:hypothetical protein
MNKNLLSFLRFLAILCVLLVLLLFIANATYRNSFKNEIKYKENFNAPLTSADPIPAGLPSRMVEGTYKEAGNQLVNAERVERWNIRKLNHAKEQERNIDEVQKRTVDSINDTKNKVKEYSGNVSKLNQTLYKMRNGDPTATKPVDKVGTFDATLYL